MAICSAEDIQTEPKRLNWNKAKKPTYLLHRRKSPFFMTTSLPQGPLMNLLALQLTLTASLTHSTRETLDGSECEDSVMGWLWWVGSGN